MTDLGLRRIAKLLADKLMSDTASDRQQRISAKYRYTINDAEAATLLNAVVEERARPIRVLKVLDGLNKGQEVPVNITDEDRTQALHELNLKGVWPEKE